jgi:hypothetical protein
MSILGEILVRQVRRPTDIFPVPTRPVWLVGKPEVGALDESQQKELHFRAATHDVTVARVGGELRRLCVVPTVNVFFEIAGKKFQIEETRTTVKNPERIGDVLKEVKRGDMDGVEIELPRNNSHSISERAKLNGEKRKNATIRTVMEELFALKLSEIGEDKYPDIEKTIGDLLHLEEPAIYKREADEAGNSFQGLPVTYFLWPASITFTPETDVPIDVVDGKPQPLYEMEEGRYIHVYKWVPV